MASQTKKSQTQDAVTHIAEYEDTVPIAFSKNTDWSFAESKMDVYEEALGEFSDKWEYTTYPSIPTTWVDIPEVKKVSVEFIYNFYTKNERTNGAGTFAVLDLSNMTQEDQAIARADRYPRFNQIHVQPTTFNNIDVSLVALARKLGPNLIKDNINFLQSENTIGTHDFAAVHLKDDFIDKEFYNSLSSAISFFGLPDDTSGNTNSKNLSSVVDDRSAFSPDGLQMRDSLSNIQSQGVSYAPTDVRKEISDTLFSSVKDVSFAFNLNNKVIKNLILGSLEDKSNVYENELRSLINPAKRLQRRSIENYVPGVIKDEDYNVELAGAFNQEVYDSPSNNSLVNESSIPVGYIIEKYEIIQNENGWEKITHDPIIVESYSPINILDLNIRYGGSYVYNVKTVCLTRIEAFRKSISGDIEDQSVFAVLMVESAGLPVKIDCTENIPPNPPQNISFRWDYQEDNLMIYWDEGLNPQRDVVRYQIFRRKSVNVPFTLAREINFDNSTSKVVPREVAPEKLITSVAGSRKIFRDLNFTKNSSYIYTLAAVDARGFTSNYSSQFLVTFDSSRNKLHKELISQSGAPKPYPNLYLNQDLFVDTMKDSGHSRLRVFFDPEYYDVFSEKADIVYDENLKSSKFVKNEEFLDLLADKYKIQIINIDNQISQIINLNVNNESGAPMKVPVNKVNATFFGLKNV